MKKTLTRLLLIALLCVPWVTNAQTHYTMQIGAGTATNSYLPNYTYYNYAYSQMLYTASEVGIDGSIDTLAFQVATGGATRDLTIYMAEVGQSDLTAQVGAEHFHQVFSGSVSWANGWTVIALDSVFEYQDTGSLVIAVIDATGSYVSSRSFNGTTKSETRSKYIYSDYDTYNLSSAMSYSSTFLPNIKLGISSYSTYCAAPSDITITGIVDDEATISWVENGNATTYELVISETPVTDFSSASAITVYDTTYNVTGLDGNTLYYVYVRAVCDASSNSAWTSAATFRSACVGYTSIPYFTDFEGISTGSMPNCWQQITTGSSSASTFPSAYTYASNARNGNVYFEFESSTGQTEIAALPEMDNLNSLMLTFYASCMSTNFVLEAGVMEDNTFVPIDTIQLTPGSSNNWHGSYYPYTVYYSNYSGNATRMALRTTASGSYTLMMDDLSVDYIPTCPPPTNGSIDSTGNDWVAFSWHENGSAASWEVAYGSVGFTANENTTGITVYDTYYTLGGLSGDSTYTIFVRSNCGGDYSAWLEVGNAQPGTYVMSLQVDTLYTCGATIFDDGGADENYSGNNNNTLVIYPASADSTLRIWGTANTESGYDYLAIYDGADTNGTQLYYGSGSADIGPFISMAQAITIHFTSDGYINQGGFELHVSCVYMPDCVPPTALSVDSVLGDTVWVSWSDTASNSTFELVYGPTGFNPDTAQIVSYNALNAELTGLTMGQQYDFYVRADCGAEQSIWIGPATATPGYSYTMGVTGSDTLHVCGYTIYDNGGEFGNYSSDCDYTLVVYPSDPTYTLQISGSGNIEQNYDYIYIYDGVGTTGTLLYTGNGNFTMPATNSEEGVVTIVFTSDFMGEYDGFEINVACIPLPECAHPSQLTVNNIGTQSADLTWTERGTATQWILQYSTSNFTPGDSNIVTSLLVNTNPYTLSGLDSGMTYYVYVAAYCNPDTSEYTGVSFTTLAATPASMPYSCDFEQSGANGWDLINGTQTNKWMVGSGASNGDSNGLYISNDNSTNTYDISSTSSVFASRTLYFDSVGEYAYSFDWRAAGESTFDYLRAALVPVSVELAAGNQGSWGTNTLPNGALALDGGNKLNQNGSWTTRTGTVNITTTGVYKFVFYWRNDYTTGTQPPAAIDNVTISLLSCPSPSNLVVTRLTSDSVFLSWSDNGAAGPWIVTYDSITTTEYNTTAAIGGLTTGTQYTFSVGTLCGNDTSFFTSIQATPGSWNMRANQTDTLYLCGGVIYDDGGANNLYSASQDSYVILYPDAPSSVVSVSGTSYTEGSWDYMRIYDGAGTSGTELWNDYGVSTTQNFGPLESTAGPLTIYFHSDASVQYAGFTINVSCVSVSCRVLNLHLNESVPESATQLAVTWDAVTDATGYQVEYGISGFAQGSGMTMNTTSNNATITGLTSLVSYDVYVRSICSGGDTGSWASATFTTAMCENPVIAESFDTTMTSTQGQYMPIGYSYYNKSYVQTIIPASRLSEIAGDITAIAFNPASTGAGNYFTGMSVYLANISEDRFNEDEFFVEDSAHQFTQVINNADFSYSTTGWQVHSLDTVFAWDGQSNILVAIIRDHGSYSSGAQFSCHTDTVARTCYDYDDYEDYDLTYAYGYTTNVVGDLQLISCGGGCPRPASLHATNVTYSGATLSWNGSATSYELSVKRANEGVWPSETAVNGTSYNATGLDAATTYHFRVRSICDAAEGMISDWMVGTFTTDSLPCMDPSDLHIVSTGYNTTTLGWTSNGTENQWSIHVWNTTFNQEYAANANPFTVTGLTPEITYYAAVKAICGNGAAESEYSDTVQFTTAACEQVTNVTVGNITNTTAVVNWNGSAARYEIEYGDLNFDQGTGTRVTVEGATTHTLTGLERNSTYSLFVRAICETGVYGAWSTQVDFTTTNSDGINTVAGEMNVDIYPNPTSSSTTIALSGVNGEVAITVVDMNGRVVMSDSMSCEGDCVKTMEVTGLAQGAYFVRVSGEGVNMVKKLVVK